MSDKVKAKNPCAVQLGHRGGEKGGPARALALPGSLRRKIAHKAAEARWGRKTPERKGYYKQLAAVGSLSKNKGRVAVKEAEKHASEDMNDCADQYATTGSVGDAGPSTVQQQPAKIPEPATVDKPKSSAKPPEPATVDKPKSLAAPLQPKVKGTFADPVQEFWRQLGPEAKEEAQRICKSHGLKTIWDEEPDWASPGPESIDHYATTGTVSGDSGASGISGAPTIPPVPKSSAAGIGGGPRIPPSGPKIPSPPKPTAPAAEKSQARGQLAAPIEPAQGRTVKGGGAVARPNVQPANGPVAQPATGPFDPQPFDEYDEPELPRATNLEQVLRTDRPGIAGTGAPPYTGPGYTDVAGELVNLKNKSSSREKRDEISKMLINHPGKYTLVKRPNGEFELKERLEADENAEQYATGAPKSLAGPITAKQQAKHYERRPLVIYPNSQKYAVNESVGTGGGGGEATPPPPPQSTAPLPAKPKELAPPLKIHEGPGTPILPDETPRLKPLARALTPTLKNPQLTAETGFPPPPAAKTADVAKVPDNLHQTMPKAEPDIKLESLAAQVKSLEGKMKTATSEGDKLTLDEQLGKVKTAIDNENDKWQRYRYSLDYLPLDVRIENIKSRDDWAREASKGENNPGQAHRRDIPTFTKRLLMSIQQDPDLGKEYQAAQAQISQNKNQMPVDLPMATLRHMLPHLGSKGHTHLDKILQTMSDANEGTLSVRELLWLLGTKKLKYDREEFDMPDPEGVGPAVA